MMKSFYRLLGYYQFNNNLLLLYKTVCIQLKASGVILGMTKRQDPWIIQYSNI